MQTRKPPKRKWRAADRPAVDFISPLTVSECERALRQLHTHKLNPFHRGGLNKVVITQVDEDSFNFQLQRIWHYRLWNRMLMAEISGHCIRHGQDGTVVTANAFVPLTAWIIVFLLLVALVGLSIAVVSDVGTEYWWVVALPALFFGSMLTFVPLLQMHDQKRWLMGKLKAALRAEDDPQMQV